MPPPRPATEARSGSLEPGRPSRARSANTRHPGGRPHTPPADRMYATDVRQHHRLMPPERGIIKTDWLKVKVTSCPAAGAQMCHITDEERSYTSLPMLSSTYHCPAVYAPNHVTQELQEAQLMLTTGSTRLAVSRGQQTWYHFGSIATFR